MKAIKIIQWLSIMSQLHGVMAKYGVKYLLCNNINNQRKLACLMKTAISSYQCQYVNLS